MTMQEIIVKIMELEKQIAQIHESLSELRSRKSKKE